MTQRIAQSTLAFCIVTLSLLFVSASAYATIVQTGSVYHAIPEDGIATGTLGIGYLFNSTGSVTVTDDTLTTQQRCTFGYTVGATGTMALTNSTWTAESAVFIASQAYTSGTVELNNSTWNVQSNMTIGQGQDSTAEVTLNDGSLWTVRYAVKIGDGKGGNGTITINDGTWKTSSVTIGGRGFTTSYGTGTININADGIMENQYPIWLTDNGTIALDGGLLSLTGENDLKGTLTATANGGTIRLDAGLTNGGYGLINLGSEVDFTDCDIEIYFRDDYIPNVSNEFNLFDPLDNVDLASSLAKANTITLPSGWNLDYETGIMSAVPEPSALLLIIMGIFTLATLYQRKR